MHYSWIAGSFDGMEETYLHHKLEAIRVVNEQISDPVLGTSDACIDTIVVLALVEVRQWPDGHQGLYNHESQVC